MSDEQIFPDTVRPTEQAINQVNSLLNNNPDPPIPVWVSVDERFPQKTITNMDQYYDVFSGRWKGKRLRARLFARTWFDEKGSIVDYVTHWLDFQ